MNADNNPEQLLEEEEVQSCSSFCKQILDELERVIYGKPELLKQVLVSLLSRGHVLLEGLPGLGKTQLVRSLSQVLALDFERIQFTPDLLPSDITGSHMIEEGKDRTEFQFHRGPVFSNIILADEINRASPKTQSALLESMEEKTVTVQGETHSLPDPFFVLATQNPIELEGTYPLPEAQKDRFRYRIVVEGVDESTMEKIIHDRPDGEPPELEPIDEGEQILDMINRVPDIHLSRPIARYISRIVSATHPDRQRAPESVQDYVRHGASPRAAIGISQTARAHALIEGRPAVNFEDVRSVAPHTLNHRLVLNHSASLDDVSSFDIIDHVLENIEELPEDLPESITVDQR